MRDPIDDFGAEEEFANEAKVWSKKKMKHLINVFYYFQVELVMTT